jgi:class 3 adenylate cyclase/tetratricopeptide (TPR) repeat protein
MSKIPFGRKFCGECGYNLSESIEPAALEAEEHQIQISESPSEETIPTPGPAEGERKHVTVLFSDLAGYTAISEKLDPEEVKEITSRIFGKISKIVEKYDGFIEKYAGDAVMSLFGVPKAHEDDPIRAIRVAREIHELVDGISPEVESRIGQSISMHTGINTGLVVTGEVDMDRGTHGVAGDTINLASRLSSLAQAGEVLVDADTCRLAEGHFTFESLEPTMVKGKTDPVRVHKVISQKERPITVHRLSGLRANLVGRKAELGALRESIENLRKGKGRIFSICGDAGSGKSRLIEEFKNTLDLAEIQWLEGHAYAYSQNIPYFPLIDLLNRVFKIEENDPQEKVKEKVEYGIEDLLGMKADVVPCLGGLYSLNYPELEDVSPEFWKSRLVDATQSIITALAQRAPTIFFLEDLHWADPSFILLLRHALMVTRHPAVVLCVYRPSISLFTSEQLSSVAEIYQEIRLQDLSLSDAQDMLESLLKTTTIPSDLKRFVHDKAEGNPFYLEELVNSLIETETLIRENGHWKITRPIAESDISSTIHGLIAGRLDRLEKETKRILQEASVIGRAFLYEILKKVSEMEECIDRGLGALERLDLIRTRSLQPDLEYMFKHPLTQEVVYNGLLKKDRKAIHEHIARVMEQLFQDRLPEFYETLAFHFKQGQSAHKAVDYLMKSGEKSLKRYAVEEAHQYYREAFDVITGNPDKLKEADVLLIDLLIKWSLVYYYRGAFNEQLDLLSKHLELAESQADKSMLGMFYAWLGFVLGLRHELGDSYEYLLKALNLGEQLNDQKVIGYASAWLAWTCIYRGLLEEAIDRGQRAQDIARRFPSDHYLYFKSLGAIGNASVSKGDIKWAMEAGKALLDYGQTHSNVRSMVLGHFVMGSGYRVMGDHRSALECGKKAAKIAADPFYYQFSRVNVGSSYAQLGQFQEADQVLQEASVFSEKFGCEVIGTPIIGVMGLVLLAKGQMGQGIKKLKEVIRVCSEKQARYWLATFELALGQVYLQIVDKSETISLSAMAKNIGFIVRNVPAAARRAEDHLKKAIAVAKEIGAKGIEGVAYLDFGRLHQAKGRSEQARDCFSKAVLIFKECGFDVYLKQANRALESLK